MAYIKIKANKHSYWVRDRDCLGAECLALGYYAHRGATGASGTRNTGLVSACCLTNAYHGCPTSPAVSKKLAAQRRKAGLKVVGSAPC